VAERFIPHQDFVEKKFGFCSGYTALLDFESTNPQIPFVFQQYLEVLTVPLLMQLLLILISEGTVISLWKCSIFSLLYSSNCLFMVEFV